MKLSPCWTYWLLFLVLLGCNRPMPTGNPSDETTEVVQEESNLVFRPLTLEPTGAFGSLAPDYSMQEIMGTGLAMWDFDVDGDLDLLVVETGWLYVQDARGHFDRHTQLYSSEPSRLATGVAVADIDNDGDEDVFIATTGLDRIFLKSNQGTFEEATEGSGLDLEKGWSTSAAFLDYDNDGWLDLYVVRYVEVDPRRVCRSQSGRREYCGPDAFPGIVDLLYRNLGEGRFAEVGRSAGIRRAGKGLGVMAADLSDDGWTDLYVANDGERNHLWINQQDGTFAEAAVPWGAAVNLQGREEASMGLALGDADGDRWMDLFVTHLDRESNTLYRGLAARAFEDISFAAGLGEPSLPFTGFGTSFGDLDLDGDLDLLVGNGKVRLEPQQAEPSNVQETGDTEDSPAQVAAYAEADQLFLNDGKGHFRWIRGAAVTVAPKISRGLLLVDWDRDGDLDVATTHVGTSPRLWRNETPRGDKHWLALTVVDPAYQRESLGASVEVRYGSSVRMLALTRSGSYLSSGDGSMHLGLGTVDRIVDLVVHWPGGGSERFSADGIDRLIRLVRGEGELLSVQKKEVEP